MSEPRKPIFGFLWPKPDPNAPVDGAYRQVRRVRVSPRGPIRVAALLLGSVVMITATGSAVMANLEAGLTALGLLVSAACATLLVLVLRGWVVGTYVTDDGVSVETTWRRVGVPWGQVREVAEVEEPCPFLGLPLRTRAVRSVLRLADGTTIATHVYGTSPDLWLRPEAFDMARLRLARWRDQA